MRSKNLFGLAVAYAILNVSKKEKNCLKRHSRVSSCFLRIKLGKVYWEMLQFFLSAFFFLMCLKHCLHLSFRRVKKQIQIWNNCKCWAHCCLKYTTAAYQCQSKIFTECMFAQWVLVFVFVLFLVLHSSWDNLVWDILFIHWACPVKQPNSLCLLLGEGGVLKIGGQNHSPVQLGDHCSD